MTDMMCVNGKKLLITSSMLIKFVNIEHVPNPMSNDLSNALNKVINYMGKLYLLYE